MGQKISFELDSIHRLSGSDYEKLSLYEQLLGSHKKNGDYTQLGLDAHQLGRWLFYKEKKWSEAIKITKIAYEAKEKAVPFNPEQLKRSYYNYANFNKSRRNYAIAIRYFRKMLEVKESIFFNGKAYALIGDCYRKLGDLYQAVENQSQAFKYFDPIKDKIFIISNHINIAIAYKNIRNQKSINTAISHLQIADSIIQTIKEPRIHDLYAINNNLGDMYFKKIGVENMHKSIAYFEKALEIAKKMKIDKNLAQINLNLGIIYSKTNSSLAKEYFNRALSYTNTKDAGYLIPKIYMGFGLSSFTEKEYLKAQIYYKKAFENYFSKEIKDVHWLPSKKELTLINDKAVFLELLKRKIQAYLANAEKENDTISYVNVIRTVKTSDELVDSMMNENLSHRSKLLWRSLASQIYIIGLEACYRLNNLEEAFYFMEKNKALLLTLEVIKKKATIPNEVLEKETEIENEIFHLQKLFQKALLTQKDSISEIILAQKNEIQQFKDSLSALYPVYFSSINSPKILPYSELEVEDDKIIIQYTMAETVARVLPDAYGMVISCNHRKLFKLKKIKSLLDKISLLREKLNTPFKTTEDINSYKKIAHQLYIELFPKTIRDEMKNKKITIVADHFLSFVPFDALITDLESGKYMIESNEINYTYSLSFQQENSSILKKADKEFLGVAPVRFSNGLSSLTKSEQEINKANVYYDGSLLVKDQALKETFIQNSNQYKILHLATHADASDSIAPWIAFRKSKLTIDELNTLKNNAELVVLSACNTSLGEIRRGEGVMSLARGFFKSGANTVIPSLWQTNDKATAIITSDFYKNLSQGKSKSEALRIAKLNYLHANVDAEASPYYWAPLILIGDTGILLPESNRLDILNASIILILLLLALYFFISKRNNKSF
ncbi:CHAT domain-containing protein [Aquimarina celericrescens]|uniref:CHAT domain-containing protein n=1 Tax=Aquimarina celericrescens TaxID=1964542 RepID=A0ABW5AXA5_9FLAO|nr:CHAT domain-containing protein [Aquimarina celericrescens]